ncbi:MAG: tripartite tricarboxylate transporter permease [Desulfovibrio sp.]|jgi:putative tricarboxylic transport membrane protein|nr:tripartite tricarboxylate transporter permease [Desulfovibrio sp.]
MEFVSFADMLSGLNALASISILFWSAAGVLIGCLFGAAPGLTATAGVAIATPLTFGVPFEQAMGLLLGIYCGGYFAGSVPAILVNTPGAPGNAATTVDGYPMTLKGRADLALGLAIAGSFLGGVFSGLVLMFLAPMLSSLALTFTAVEYSSFGFFGLICVAAVSGGSILRGCVGAVLGMLLGCVGIDPVDGVLRLTFGLPGLLTGIPLIPALIAFFAITEMFNQGGAEKLRALPPQQKSGLAEIIGFFFRHKLLSLKSALIGTGIGILPGTGPTIASWISYGEAATAGCPDEDPLGEGAPRGVIASEVANNAVTGGALVPLLTLGIPGDTVTAILLGALTIQNIAPGPLFIVEHGNLFVLIVGILMLSNVWLFLFGMVLRPFLPRMLERLPVNVLVPLIGIMAATGCFADGNTAFPVALMGILGVAAYYLQCLGLPMPPLVLGLVLGPIIEKNLRDALTVHRMDLSVFVTRPLSATLIAAAVLTVLVAARRGMSGKTG